MSGSRALPLRSALLLWACLAAFFWAGTGRVSLFDRDEPRFAGPAREMLMAQTWQGWVVPQFNGEPFFHKPPLCYWQTALALGAFGVGEFPARFFSGLWTAATAVLLAACLSRRISVAVGVTAALIFSTSLLVSAEAKLATADATLGLLTLAAALALWDCRDGRATGRTKAALWLSVGLALLCKGPAILVVLVGLTAALLVIDRDRSWALRIGLWWGVPLALAVGLPWYLLADRLAGGGLVQRFVWYDLFERIVQPLESHRGFPGFYLAAALIDTWPWSGFLAPLAGFAWRRRRERDVRFLLAWLIGPTLLLELMATKMVHYWLVVLPAFVILLALALDAWAADQELERGLFAKGNVFVVVGVIWAALGAAVMVGQRSVFGERLAPLTAFAAVLLLAAVVTAFAGRQLSLRGGILALAATTAVVTLVASLVALPGLERYKLSRHLAAAMTARGDARTTYALIGWEEPATIYYLHAGRAPVSIASREQFGTLIRQPHVVVGLSQQAFSQLGPLPDGVSAVRVEGFEYTRGRRDAAYVAWGAP